MPIIHPKWNEYQSLKHRETITYELIPRFAGDFVIMELTLMEAFL